MASRDETFGPGRQTLFVNAAMGNKYGKPENRPWLVDLVLAESKYC